EPPPPPPLPPPAPPAPPSEAPAPTVLADDAKCSAKPVCKQLGLCGSRDGVCAAIHEAHCAAAAICKQRQQCRVSKAGHCVR
ncbi:MAG: hypothetical protein KC503_36490, partial [Myxococcales bacterium]|nr:hypothetical protein [Myxococcales bacterium]